ncbi:MAG: hypothetical protein IPI23_01350 [Bacteroidetes bacterium]|nr:hypothetical protein [Bacteroidota bacterium]MBK7387744.1 hypothetical protein [Bacteroidota bacterium]MBK7971191.1 hypothetical protein [Bacteroidota bacterium]MBK9046916.1 hypothetical protein [Bacteroidota bacterium]
MNPIVRNILAVIAGLILGGVVNMGIVTISDSIIPLPEGADVTTPEGLKASIHLFEPRHFIMPFLAHALGTFVGALVASLIAANRKMLFAIVIGLFNLTGGIVAVTMIPAPMWFNVTDLVLAYIPMAFLAGKLGSSKK